MTDTVLVIGAGFPKSLNEEFPMENDVVAQGVRVLESQEPSCLNELDNAIRKFFPQLDFKKHTVEELLSKIDIEMYIFYNAWQNDSFNESIREEKRRKYYQLLRIRETILLIFWKSINLEISTDSLKKSAEFLRILGSKLTILSFNQDFVIERICQEESISWNYGIPIITRSRARDKSHEDKFYFEKDEANELEQSEYARAYLKKRIPLYDFKKGDIALLKLHGSFNWFYCPRCESFRGRPFDKSGVSGRPFSFQEANKDWPLCTNLDCIKISNSQVLFTPLVIAPTYMKTYFMCFIPDLWDRAHHDLSKAKKLIVFGFSFREEDALAIQMFYNLASRNPNLSEIIVIDKAGDKVADRIEKITKLSCQKFISLDEYLSSIN